MTIQKVLSNLFSTEVKFSIFNKNVYFVFADCDIYVNEDGVEFVDDNNHETKIEFCEIKDIIVEDDIVLFALQSGGYRFDDGDFFKIRRK